MNENQKNRLSLNGAVRLDHWKCRFAGFKHRDLHLFAKIERVLEGSAHSPWAVVCDRAVVR